MNKNEEKYDLVKAVANLNHEKEMYPLESDLHVIISGLNKKSKNALINKKLVIRHFPFKIGRASFGNCLSLSGPDFLVTENEPGRISRNHLSIVIQEGQIILIDENSRFGSFVNGTLLGKNVAGKDRITLRYGENIVKIGGRSSPYIFKFKVVRRDDGKVLEDYIRCGNNVIPVAALYIKLCHAVKEIISPSSLDIRERISMAMELSTFIAEDKRRSEMLHCYAAHPDTYSDIIVAHSTNVCIYVIQFAQGLSYSPEEVKKIGAAALLHDIGMYKIPPEIVNKKETISPDEFEIMKTHTTDGYDEFSPIENGLKIIPSVIYEHHERVDGSGYPQGKIIFEEIVELIGLIDFFEAITHCRPQRGPLTPHEGIQMLIACKDKPFSSELVKTFIKRFSLFPVFSIVRLNSGELGQVINSNPDWILRPIVRILFDSFGQPLKERRDLDLSKEKDFFITKDISDRIFIDKYFKI